MKRQIDANWTSSRKDVSAGVNMTFTAPKGFSVAALLTEDQRLLSAHEQAVLATLDFMEHNQTYRQRDEGKTVDKPVTGLLFALYNRFRSRANDPLLHTHVIMPSLTKRQDGIFCAVNTINLFYQKKLLGMVYRTELSAYLAEYHQIGLNWCDDLCELPGVSEELIGLFSKRSQQIKTALDKDGVVNKETSQKHIKAVSQFTAPKTPVAKRIFHEWQSVWLEECGSPEKVWVEPQKSLPSSPDVVCDMDEIIVTFDRLAQDRTGVNTHKLLYQLLVKNQGFLPVRHFRETIDNLVDAGHWIEDGFPRTLYTPEGFAKQVEQKAKLKKNKVRLDQALIDPTVHNVKIGLTANEWSRFESVMKRKGWTASVLIRNCFNCLDRVDRGVSPGDRSGRKNFPVKARISDKIHKQIANLCVDFDVSVGDVFILAFSILELDALH